MSKTNKVSVVFTDAEKEAVIAKITQAKEALPFLISLTTDERRTSRKMGSKSIDYVRQCLEGAKAFPDELKKSFDVAEMEKDYNLVNNLLGVQVACQDLLDLINDTLMLGGIEAIAAADDVYATLKISAKRDGSVKSIVDKIAERFKGQGKTIVIKTV
jgi:hypothetical protein